MCFHKLQKVALNFFSTCIWLSLWIASRISYIILTCLKCFWLCLLIEDPIAKRFIESSPKHLPDNKDMAAGNINIQSAFKVLMQIHLAMLHSFIQSALPRLVEYSIGKILSSKVILKLLSHFTYIIAWAGCTIKPSSLKNKYSQLNKIDLVEWCSCF